jgi:hypothetical protein
VKNVRSYSDKISVLWLLEDKLYTCLKRTKVGRCFVGVQAELEKEPTGY